MVVGMLLYSFVLKLELIKYPIPSHFDDEAISLLYLRRPRDAMMPRAP